MRVRIVTVAVTATLAVTGLAGCRTNIGTAATVNGHRITESEVNGYLTPTGPAPSVVANAKANGQPLSPRSQILQFLIQEQIFERTLHSFGTVPTAAQLASTHDSAARVLLQTDLTGAALDRAIRKGLPGSGISAKFASVYLRVQELEYAIIEAKKLTQLPELLALVDKAGVRVSVNARYGQWSPSNLGLDGKARVPAYLLVQPTPGQSVPQGTS